MTFIILNGSSHLGPIFLWWFVFRFLVSSHTLSPFLNGINVDLRHSIIQVQASSWAVNASSLSLISVLILSSIVRNLVFLNERRIAIGDSLNISSNGVLCRSACLLLLWVNSRVANASIHSSRWVVQYIDRYTSISWFTLSVVMVVFCCPVINISLP